MKPQFDPRFLAMIVRRNALRGIDPAKNLDLEMDRLILAHLFAGGLAGHFIEKPSFLLSKDCVAVQAWAETGGGYHEDNFVVKELRGDWYHHEDNL